MLSESLQGMTTSAQTERIRMPNKYVLNLPILAKYRARQMVLRITFLWGVKLPRTLSRAPLTSNEAEALRTN